MSASETKGTEGEKKRKLEHKDNKQGKRQKGSFAPFKNWKKHTKLFNATHIVRGVLLTGEHAREGNMIGEMLHTFKYFIDLFYPHLSKLSPIPPEEPEEENKEGETKEGGTEEAEEPKKQKLFEVINSGCSGMAIISFVPKEIEPVEFTRRMLEHIIEKKEPRPTFSVDFTSRIVPLEATCEVSPSLERFLEISKPVIEQYFKDKPACKFAIRVEHRNCNSFDKMKCINALAPLVDPVHKVDLDNPDLVIMVQVFKSACGISVLPDYNKLRKYNIKEAFKAVQGGNQKEKAKTKTKENDGEASNTTATTTTATEQEST